MGCCSHSHRHTCAPKCRRRCVGTITTKYRVYENCCYDIMKVCPRCGCEFHNHQYHACPKCGMQMDDPPRFGAFGGRIGGFGRFEGFGRRRFGEFSPFGFGFFPDFEEEEEEEEFF